MSPHVFLKRAVQHACGAHVLPGWQCKVRAAFFVLNTCHVCIVRQAAQAAHALVETCISDPAYGSTVTFVSLHAHACQAAFAILAAAQCAMLGARITGHEWCTCARLL